MTTRLAGLVSVGILVVAGSGLGAQEPGEQAARAIIKKAIESHGGKDNLQRYERYSLRGKGTLVGTDGMEAEIEIEYWSQYPNRTKTAARITFQEMQLKRVRVLNGDQGWEQVDGNTRMATKEELRVMQQTAYETHVLRFYPLLEDPGFTLTLAERAKVGSRTTLGVRVGYQGRTEITLYFDESTSLLAKTKVPDIEEQEGVLEAFYSDYKTIEGRKYPMRQRILLNGKKYLETELTEMRPLEKIDPATFAKPQ